jgi:hypothetical protein
VEVIIVGVDILKVNILEVDILEVAILEFDILTQPHFFLAFFFAFHRKFSSEKNVPVQQMAETAATDKKMFSPTVALRVQAATASVNRVARWFVFKQKIPIWVNF